MDSGFNAVLLAAAQVAPGSPTAPPPAAMLTPERPALVQQRVVENCPEARGSDIVVCGRTDADARHRLPPGRAAGPEEDAPRNVLGFQISESIQAQLDPVQYQLPNGMIAQGIVARVRIAF